MIVRSYRVCFQLERRLHRLDRWRIPVPYGVPLRGIGYAIATLAAIVILDGVPVTAQLLGALHPILRYAIVPVGVAYLLMQWTIDGRAAHHAALAWVRHQLAPRRLVAFRPRGAPGPVRLGQVVIAPDDRHARMRRAVVTGPAQVILRYPVRARRQGSALRVRRMPGRPQWRGQQIQLKHGQRVVIE